MAMERSLFKSLLERGLRGGGGGGGSRAGELPALRYLREHPEKRRREYQPAKVDRLKRGIYYGWLEDEKERLEAKRIPAERRRLRQKRREREEDWQPAITQVKSRGR